MNILYYINFNTTYILDQLPNVISFIQIRNEIPLIISEVISRYKIIIKDLFLHELMEHSLDVPMILQFLVGCQILSPTYYIWVLSFLNIEDRSIQHIHNFMFSWIKRFGVFGMFGIVVFRIQGFTIVILISIMKSLVK